MSVLDDPPEPPRRVVAVRPDGIYEIFGIIDAVKDREIPSFVFTGLDGIYDPVRDGISYVLYQRREEEKPS